MLGMVWDMLRSSRLYDRYYKSYFFYVLHFIIELLSIFVVMINVSKIEKTIILQIPCQISFSVNDFCLPTELCPIHPFSFGQD